jgi:DNA-binding Xre family transcriptional regulator
MDVEKRLNALIEERCISKQALAVKSGVDTQTLYRCLRAEQPLKASEFLAICTALEVDPKNFLDG